MHGGDRDDEADDAKEQRHGDVPETLSDRVGVSGDDERDDGRKGPWRSSGSCGSESYKSCA